MNPDVWLTAGQIFSQPSCLIVVGKLLGEEVRRQECVRLRVGLRKSRSMRPSEECLAELRHKKLNLIRLRFKVPLVADWHRSTDRINAHDQGPFVCDYLSLPDQHCSFRYCDHGEENQQPPQEGASGFRPSKAGVECPKLLVNF